jgi:Protein of unknown function (DUF4232)
MRSVILLLTYSLAVFGHAFSRFSDSSVAPAPFVPRCSREALTLKQGETDAAMGGVRATDFTITNKSSTPCTLNGYPRLELLDRKGVVRRRATASAQLPGDTVKMPPQTVTVDAGKTATFQIQFNSGGAGHMGKPCPTYPKLKILVPGTTRAFVLHSDIQSCGGTELQVSAVRAATNP